MKKLTLLLVLLALLVAFAAMASTPATYAPTAAAKVADTLKNTQAAAPFDDVGIIAASATVTAMVATNPPATTLDITSTAAKLATTPTTITGTYPTPTQAAARGDTTTLWNTVANTWTLSIVAAYKSPPDAMVATTNTDIVEATAAPPPQHEVAIREGRTEEGQTPS